MQNRTVWGETATNKPPKHGGGSCFQRSKELSNFRGVEDGKPRGNQAAEKRRVPFVCTDGLMTETSSGQAVLTWAEAPPVLEVL